MNSWLAFMLGWGCCTVFFTAIAAWMEAAGGEAAAEECHICHRPRDQAGEWYCSAAHPLRGEAAGQGEEPQREPWRCACFGAGRRSIHCDRCLTCGHHAPWVRVERCPITPEHGGHPWQVQGEGAGPRWCNGTRSGGEAGKEKP